MSDHGESSLRIPIPRGHALRDVAFVTFLLVVIAAFLANSVRL